MSAEISANSTFLPATSISQDRCGPTGGTAVVAGATGSTVRQAVKALHIKGFRVRVVVRDYKRLADHFAESGSLRKAS